MKRSDTGPPRLRIIEHRIRIHCHRIQRMRELGEHASCPYCYGRTADIEAGEHARFCDFDPEVDPISFGFPLRGSRSCKG